jgi:hypothetical protein
MQNRSILVSTAAGLMLAVTAACASHRVDAKPRVTHGDESERGRQLNRRVEILLKARAS